MDKIVIIAKESGDRLDALLVRSVDGLTRSAAQRLIETGAVTLNGAALKKSHKVTDGEIFSLFLPEVGNSELIPEEISLDVVYEDSDVIVVNKPRGMVVHPAPGHPGGTLVNALLWHCGDSLSGIGGEKRPGIVHRIDKDTSGLIIAAKNDAAHLSLSSQLADRSLSRVYEAVAVGNFKDDSGTIDRPIGRHHVDRKRMAVTQKNSRSAVTHWEVIARYNGYTHIRCHLETGRTHQIRVHLASIGHPVLGDMVYGRKKPEKGLEGQCLHARELKFIHPSSGEPVHISTDLPLYFLDVLKRLNP